MEGWGGLGGGLIAAARTDESGGWSLACEIQRKESLRFSETVEGDNPRPSLGACLLL